MSMKLPFLLLFIACTSLLSANAADHLEEDVKAATLVRKDQAAPDFTCRTTDNREIKLSALKGKVVLLYFFSTKSVPASVFEMKYLEKEIFQKLQKRDDFQLLAIGRGHTREELVKIGGENKLTFPLVPDEKEEICRHYFNKFVPRKVVLRRDGTIAYLASGYAEFDGIVNLQQVIARELAYKP
jgi:peroxiredoxin